MVKFGMSDYEVSQNIIGVAIGNFILMGAVVGAIAVSAVGLIGFGLYKAFF